MAVYWLTFRLASDATYSDRYDALKESIRGMASAWWYEPSSFFLFESSEDIDRVAANVGSVINAAKDIVLIGMPDYKSARVLGASTDKDLFKLMPFTKYA